MKRFLVCLTLCFTALAGSRSHGRQLTRCHDGYKVRDFQRVLATRYEMTRVIDQRCGRACVRQLCDKPPAAFFPRYIEI